MNRPCDEKRPFSHPNDSRPPEAEDEDPQPFKPNSSTTAATIAPIRVIRVDVLMTSVRSPSNPDLT